MAATVTFPGGPETRLYEVEVHRKTGKSFIKTKESVDISGTKAHARALLKAWFDGWIAGEEQKDFVDKRPEAAGKLTVDITRASISAEGNRLVRYDITNVTPAPKGYRFAVTAMIEDRGTPETKILHYLVYKDRFLSERRWTITGQ